MLKKEDLLTKKEEIALDLAILKGNQKIIDFMCILKNILFI